MLESFMRSKEVWPEERPILFVWSVAVASDPRPVLPEPSVGLLITKEIVVIGLGVWSVGREVIGRGKPHMRPTKAGARRIGMQRQV